MFKVPENYDPTKPLLMENPRHYLSKDSLEFDQKDNVTDFYYFYKGIRLPNKDYQLVFRCKMSEKKLLKMDVVPSRFLGVGLIANQKVLNIFQEVCPNDFQAFPVIIKNISSDGYINNDYFLIYIINRIDVLDIDNSEFSLDDETKPKQRGNIVSAKKIRFKSNCMGDAHIARDIEIYSIIFMSHFLYSILYKENVRGIECMPDYLSRYERRFYPELFWDQE